MFSTSSYSVWLVSTCISLLTLHAEWSRGALRPQDSESRLTKTLDGLWSFKVASVLDPDQGFREQWFSRPLTNAQTMPVPSSYNDIGTNEHLRNHVGWVWYQTNFFLPNDCLSQDKSVSIRFGSVHYTAMVYVDGELLTSHSIGHLPFEAELLSTSTSKSKSKSHTLTVAVNNTLTMTSIPQGSLRWREECESVSCSDSSKFYLDYNFDFFNYAGIHRPVVLHCQPKSRIDKLRLSTWVNSELNRAVIFVEVEARAEQLLQPFVVLRLIDEAGVQIVESVLHVGHDTLNKAEMLVDNPKLWWPFLSGDQEVFGYQYTLQLSLMEKQDVVVDVYRQKLGIRSLSMTNSSLLLNHRPLYLYGFGKHEDSDIRGKGLDLPTLVRDFNLMLWLKNNAIRTSHYPYSEELLDMADSMGLLIIDESPAVALDDFSDELKENHKRSMLEMINRDINRPSVIIWSLANEPRSTRMRAGMYFKDIVEYTRRLDETRPIMVVVNAPVDSDRATEHVDVIGINRYFGWYSQSGVPELITDMLVEDVKKWKQRHNKLLMVTEYGAGSLASLHSLPARMFTEEYQVELMKRTFDAFDMLREKQMIIGELIWNFADFMTKQETNRVDGNRKGVFNRQRQPKMAAHFIRNRFEKLSSYNNRTATHHCSPNHLVL